jgi:uncharacterized protein involved in exopolysaccharide biosynthesis/Mrp family chromosome partitioning ATPase
MKSPSSNSKRPARPASGFNIHDILFVLFKHKWKIMFFSLLGFGGAGAVIYKASLSPTYETQAKLLVRYVVERNAVDSFQLKADAGTGVMDTELELIRSSDLAMEVAEKVGPEKLIPDPDPEEPPTKSVAAQQIVRNLDVSSSRGSAVIHVGYRHPDPQTATAVLNQLIETYFKRHLELHRSTGAFEEVARQTELARSRLSQTEQELAKLNTDSGFVSLADGKAALESRRGFIRQSLMDAQVELAEQKMKVAAMEKAMGVEPLAAPKQEETAVATDQSKEENPTERRERVTAQQQYRDLADQLSMFKQKRNQLMISRKPGDRMLVALDAQIAEIQKRGLDLIEQHPGLAGQTQMQLAGSEPQNNPVAELNAERARVASLEARLDAISEQAKKVDAEMEKITNIGLEFASLERRRKLEEEKYSYFETSLDKARVDETLNPASMPNIGVIQTPSTPVMSIDTTTKKLAFGLAAAGLMFGLGLAFLIELVIDRRVSRPTEIQTRLQLPLMMSIPRIRSRDGIEKLIGQDRMLAVSGEIPNLMGPNGSTNGKGALANIQEDEHFITPYASAIRDRIMFNFELNNITHKPKLIALTGLSEGAGTSTIAASVAKAFAENGNRKVLLVDLNPPKRGSKLPAAHPDSLQTALAISNSERFRLSPRTLYFASAPTRQNGKGSGSLAAVALHELMPQLESSDFDYIVFDMPPVGPTSPTVAMAGFMDKVLLILDAENTNRESLSWSYAELEKGRADVSCIFNKAKFHAPRWVAGEM